MASNRLPHKQRSIEKIQNAKVLERLIKHFKGDLELTASQVKVGLSLIKKYIPDVKQTEHTGSVQHKHTQELSRDELLRIAATGRAGDSKARPGSGEPDSVH